MAKITSIHTSGNPVGAILACGNSGALPRTLLCNGAAVSRTTYAALFAAIGTSFGSGDGSTTFNVPDTRNIFLRGANSSTRTISTILYPAIPLGTTVTDKMQGHKHDYLLDASGGATQGPQNVSAYPIAPVGAAVVGNPSNDGTNGAPRTGSETAPVHLGINYCIAY